MIPSYEDLMLPLLKFAEDEKEHHIHNAVEALSISYQLTDDEKLQTIKSGRQTVIYNRVVWARTYLKKAGLLQDPRRGFFQITKEGVNLLSTNPKRIDDEILMRYPSFQEFQSRKDAPKPGFNKESDDERTPEELLESAFDEIETRLADNLIDIILKSSPVFFERLVIDLLLAMGYGGSQNELAEAVGKSGDEGIDGIIDQDRLGLDRIYIQAKRWDPNQTVSRPEIQKFVGALSGKHAKKGIFITTAKYSNEAKAYVSQLDVKVVLIDGEQLARFMIEYEVGVETQTVYKIKTIHTDYFSVSEI